MKPFCIAYVIVTHVRKCVLAKAREAMLLQQAREGITVYMQQVQQVALTPATFHSVYLNLPQYQDCDCSMFDQCVMTDTSHIQCNE